jgi:hypothetical protein
VVASSGKVCTSFQFVCMTGASCRLQLACWARVLLGATRFEFSPSLIDLNSMSGHKGLLSLKDGVVYFAYCQRPLCCVNCVRTVVHAEPRYVLETRTAVPCSSVSSSVSGLTAVECNDQPCNPEILCRTYCMLGKCAVLRCIPWDRCGSWSWHVIHDDRP